MADYYEVLGVPRSATASDVRKAYARIARDRHPDRFSDPAEKERAQEFFKEATAAFNTLSNERSRRDYDAELAKPKLTTPEEQAAAAVAEAQEVLKAGNLGGAIDRVRQAVYLQPQETKYRLGLARLLAKHPQTAREGIQVLEELTRQDPRNAAAFFDLALAYQAQGLALRARKAAEAAVAIDPGNHALQTLLASLRPTDPEPGGGSGLGGFLKRKP
jgi:curved DNA-binding protein CbpA